MKIYHVAILIILAAVAISTVFSYILSINDPIIIGFVTGTICGLIAIVFLKKINSKGNS